MTAPTLPASRVEVAGVSTRFGGTATGERRTYGRAAWTDHALALLDTLGIGTVDIIGNSMGGAIGLSIAVARPQAARRLVLMGSRGGRWPSPAGWIPYGATPRGWSRCAGVIGLFAHNRDLITDELVELRHRASIDPPVRESWAAMFPAPRQRWVDDLALPGAELASITAPVLLVHGREDRVVP